MKESNLIFLISLPRSGSTMLQKMLGTHKDLYTKSESWLSLYPLSFFRKGAIEADYDHDVAISAVSDFLGSNAVSGSKCKYFKAQKLALMNLYGDQLDSREEIFFLDKTPRYYKIYDELQDTFQDAKFIILYRNPMAVLSSVINTWADVRIENLNKFSDDLNQGIDFLGRDFSGKTNVCEVKYEDLLAQPETELTRLQGFLGLKEDASNVSYDNRAEWLYGDQASVYKKNKPDLVHRDQWISGLSKPANYFLSKDYLEHIGKERYSKTGYSFESALSSLAEFDQSHLTDGRAIPTIGNLFLPENEKTNASLEALKEEKQRLLVKSDGYEAELVKASDALEKVNAKISFMTDSLNENESKIKSLVNELEKSTDDCSNLESEVKILKQSFKVEKQLTEKLRTKNDGLNEILESINVRSKQDSEGFAEKLQHLAELQAAVLNVSRVNFWINPRLKLRTYKALVQMVLETVNSEN